MIYSESDSEGRRKVEAWKEYTIHREWNHKSTTNEYKDYDIVYERGHDTIYVVVYYKQHL